MADLKLGQSSSKPAAPTTNDNSAPKQNQNVSSAAQSRLSHIQGRAPKHSPSPGPLRFPRRRSSVLSFSSLEDATLSFTEEVINTRPYPQSLENGRELTHWHSSPLVFAILPALSGLLFKNGSAFVTDMLLLGLAAIFMNWSIRLPWDWYYSAQASQLIDESSQYVKTSERDLENIAVDTNSSPGNSPRPSFASARDESPVNVNRIDEAHEAAATGLRRQELLALAATFVFPACAAYLLHVIRAQLSGPSTNLVSDYNLSIFLLAALVQPCRQLARLVAHRTLHLQKIVSRSDSHFSGHRDDTSALVDLTNRLSDLEARIRNQTLTQSDLPLAQISDVNALSAEMRKRFEPRLEGLERAVRRYEKRSTTLAIMMDQRLQALELRTQEALSLAAVAAQHSKSRGSISALVDMVFLSIARLIKLFWSICTWPLTFFEELYARFKTLMLGPAPPQIHRKTRGVRNGKNKDKPAA